MEEDQKVILIVDDEEPIRDILSRKLRVEGYECVTAANGTEALKNAFMHDLDIVLLDVKMPGMSGMEVLSKLVIDHPDTSIIMVSAVTDINTAISAMKLGAYDYLTKPFNMDDLLMRLERALERRRLILKNKEYQRRLEQRVEQQEGQIQEYYQEAVEALSREQIALSKLVNALGPYRSDQDFLQMIEAMSLMAEMHEPYIRGHSQRVSIMANAIALEFGCSKESVLEIQLAAKVHDIGKVVIPDHILFKPGPLTPSECSEVKRHPVAAVDILRPVSYFKSVLPLIESHHEYYDGKGYPHGLGGDNIPLGARVLAVADAYDAMTCPRPYRPRLSSEEAAETLKKGAAKQWDQEVVRAFLRVLQRESKKLLVST
jgi:cyclic di-GMP phosphodiesterase